MIIVGDRVLRLGINYVDVIFIVTKVSICKDSRNHCGDLNNCIGRIYSIYNEKENLLMGACYEQLIKL